MKKKTKLLNKKGIWVKNCCKRDRTNVNNLLQNLRLIFKFFREREKDTFSLTLKK